MPGPGFMGFMWVARRDCGKVAAAIWEDPGTEESVAWSVAEWRRRKLQVERIKRYAGDPKPKWVCPVCSRCDGMDRLPFIEGPFGEMPANL